MDIAVFVNSCDSFEDCWVPFFKLFSFYGGILRDCPVYLNTERAEFSWGGLNLCSTRVWPLEEVARPSWSYCLQRGLEAVEQKYILYLQEDYFLTQAIRDEVVEEAVSILQDFPDTGVVYLSRNGPRVRKSLPHSKSFLEVCPPAPYLINTQAAIWNKVYLRSLARSWENAWMFEKFATLRERHTPRQILKVTPQALQGGDVIQYVWSGVMKGKWKPECVDLFQTHGIVADFDQRGFYKEGSLLKFRLEVLHKLFGRPVPALRSIFSLLNNAPAAL